MGLSASSFHPTDLGCTQKEEAFLFSDFYLPFFCGSQIASSFQTGSIFLENVEGVNRGTLENDVLVNEIPPVLCQAS